MARKKLSSEETKKRQDFLKAETIEQRTIRVLNPRLTKLRQSMTVLTKAFKSPRYALTDVQKEQIENDLDDYYLSLITAVKDSTSEDSIEDIL
jgi:hypothetical protein